jgi:hypothetical protein
VLHGDRALELRLRFGVARNGKVHSPKLFRVPGRVLVFFVRWGPGRQGKHDTSKQQTFGNSHGILLWWAALPIDHFTLL